MQAPVIKGILSEILDMRVNLVNAAQPAQRRGIEFSERSVRQSEIRFESPLVLHIMAGDEDLTVHGYEQHDRRYMVVVNDLWVDIAAPGNMLISLHEDRPGIIGQVGAALD